MTQNIYDDDEFFAGYSRLLRSVEGLDGAPEWPRLRAWLPDLRGRSVVDLGCGFGWFCRWAREQGAARVLGVDISEKMLARATAGTQDQAITYLRADLEHLDLPAATFDLAYSSLAFHYLENLGALIGRVARSLAPSGMLVFSVEHPMFTAPARAGMVGRRGWPQDLARQRVSGRRTALDQLADRRRHQAASDLRDLHQHADRSRFHAAQCRGMGTLGRADRGPSRHGPANASARPSSSWPRQLEVSSMPVRR